MIRQLSPRWAAVALLASLAAPLLASDPAVVLIPGIGNSGQRWRDKGIVRSLTETGKFHDAGDCPMDGDLPPRVEGPGQAVYTVTLRDLGQGSLYDSGRDLGGLLEGLRRERGQEKFILVGKSLGGVVAREYVTSCHYAEDVVRLITVASPHLGSELTVLPQWHAQLTASLEEAKQTASQPRRWMEYPAHWGKGTLVALETKTADTLAGLSRSAPWNIDAPGLLMLRPPEAGNYLDRLNHRPHPKSVAYTCVITSKHFGNYGLDDMREDWVKWRHGECQYCRFWMALGDAGRATLGACAGEWDLAGDGAVSKRSQNLNHTPAFQNDGPRAEVVEIDAGHHDEQTGLDLAKLILPRE